MATQKYNKKIKTPVVITPRDCMSSTPVFKFPPTPTKDFMVIYSSDTNTDVVFAAPVDFIAVCEWSDEWLDENGEKQEELYEGVCFLVLEGGGSCHVDIIYSGDRHPVSNQIGVVRADELYWRNPKTGKNQPIYKWDAMQQANVHPIEGKLEND